jgi:PAS domain S-box-containing protein
MLTLLFAVLAILGFGASIYLFVRSENVKDVIEKSEQNLNRRIYELAILKEIGDRVGYSLDVQQIVDIITSSLHQFIEYAAVSYMLIEPEKVVFKMHLERSVHRRFVNDVRDRMLSALGALMDREFKKEGVKEVLSGAILLEEVDEPVSSFFNIPLVIGEKVVGVLTVADTKSGLYKEEEMTILYKLIQQASKAVTRLQQVVKTEQEKVSAMVESMEDGVVMTDQDYRILVINPAAKRVIGLEKKAEITIFDFIDNLGGKMDMRGRLEESVKLKKNFTSERFEVNGKYYQAFVFPVKTAMSANADDILGGVVIFHDVSHEMELERVREDFTSMIVHELRTPLSGIQKTSELLKQPAKKDAATRKQYIDIIYQNSSGMLNMVNDILDAAKLQAGKFEVSKEAGDIAEVITNRVAFFNVSAADRHIALLTTLAPDLPTDVPFDIQRVKQVLNNLMSNALKFSPEKSTIALGAFVHEAGATLADEVKKAKIAVAEALPDSAVSAADRSLVVTVTDAGPGIAADQMPKLFNKFKQLDNKSFVSQIKGTGLGLAIAKGIVESHGGHIGVVSKVGVGSTFYFVLPYPERAA